MQLALPFVAVKDPAAQRVHTVAPVLFAYLPSSHEVQTPPARLLLPAAHGVQVLLPSLVVLDP